MQPEYAGSSRLAGERPDVLCDVMHVAVIGGGPAGLRAAEVARGAGADVTVFDAKPSVGRKFLVAGRGGLNLTHAEAPDTFRQRYRGGEPRWASLLAACDADALRAWAAGLGVETFVASSGRVYPREMKAAPLLRRWVHRLREAGVTFRLKHRWSGLVPGAPLTLTFSTADGQATVMADAVVLALGGGSWPETGSDGGWVSTLRSLGVQVADLAPANCGWEVAWSAELLTRAEGRPLKNLVVTAGNVSVPGELLVTKYGLEGGGIYQLGSVLRGMAEPGIVIDFKPAHTVAALVAKLGPIRRNFLAESRSRWRLDDATHALLSEGISEADVVSGEALAARVKACPVRLTRPRPLAEAISSAGGVAWDELDNTLGVKRVPGLYVAGEMVDWEAPTGGYLMQGCFATGSVAGKAAAGGGRLIS